MKMKMILLRSRTLSNENNSRLDQWWKFIDYIDIEFIHVFLVMTKLTTILFYTF